MDEFIDALLGYIEQVQQDMDDIDEEEFEQIMSVLQELLSFALEQQELEQAGFGINEGETGITNAEYPSSNINGFRYDPQSKKLLIKFMGKDVADGGPVYQYDGVPDFIFDIIKRGAVAPKTSGKNKYHEWFKGITPSHGASVNALIKKAGFNYKKVA